MNITQYRVRITDTFQINKLQEFNFFLVTGCHDFKTLSSFKKKNKSKIKEKGNLLVLSIIAYVSIVLVKYI